LVHYCKREASLAEKRKRPKKWGYNADPEDPSQARLQLLGRTLREDLTDLGRRVQFFKTHYSLREHCPPDLASAIAVMPNLRYVDLPVGPFTTKQCEKLLLEVQARCPELRKMAFGRGSEPSLISLGEGRIWTKLESLDLVNIELEPVAMRCVLGALTNLRALKVAGSETFGDQVFEIGDEREDLQPFPALVELILERTPKVTEKGLTRYLRTTGAKNTLHSLTLSKTGVNPANLQSILGDASTLSMLVINTAVSKPMPTGPSLRKLGSSSLQTLHFVIDGENRAGYYTLLASSIIAGGLSKLKVVFSGDPALPGYLQGVPPRPPPLPIKNVNPRPASVASGTGPLSTRSAIGPPAFRRFSSNNPFAEASSSDGGRTASLTRSLVVYTRVSSESTWTSNVVRPQLSPPSPGHGGAPETPPRPRSSYGFRSDAAGSGFDVFGSRRSVMVGSTAGGFLEIPETPAGGGQADGDASPRPKSSGSQMSPNRDLWR
jgi:hypothetical protein